MAVPLLGFPPSSKPVPLGLSFERSVANCAKLSKRIERWRDLRQRGLATNVNRFLAGAVSILLTLALVYALVHLAWVPILDESIEATVTMETSVAQTLSPQAVSAIDHSLIADSHLFGKAASEPVTEIAANEPTTPEPPATTLNLRLKATIANTGNDRGGVAIIASGGVERTYFVADAIDGARGAQLHEIHANHVVVLTRNGRLETLRFPEVYDSGRVDLASSAAMTLPPTIPTPLPPGAPAQDPVDNIALLQGSRSEGALPPSATGANSNSIDDIVLVAEHIEQGRTVGLRVDPGRQAEQFDELGFEPGDVLTGINGTDLSDTERGLQAFGRLGENAMANVTLVRDGVARILTIDTSSIAEPGTDF